MFSPAVRAALLRLAATAADPRNTTMRVVRDAQSTNDQNENSWTKNSWLKNHETLTCSTGKHEGNTHTLNKIQKDDNRGCTVNVRWPSKKV